MGQSRADGDGRPNGSSITAFDDYKVEFKGCSSVWAVQTGTELLPETVDVEVYDAATSDVRWITVDADASTSVPGQYGSDPVYKFDVHEHFDRAEGDDKVLALRVDGHLASNRHRCAQNVPADDVPDDDVPDDDVPDDDANDGDDGANGDDGVNDDEDDVNDDDANDAGRNDDEDNVRNDAGTDEGDEDDGEDGLRHTPDDRADDGTPESPTGTPCVTPAELDDGNEGAGCPGNVAEYPTPDATCVTLTESGAGSRDTACPSSVTDTEKATDDTPEGDDDNSSTGTSGFGVIAALVALVAAALVALRREN